MERPDPDILTVVLVLVISAVSGFVSITQRLLRGAPASALWFISEFLAAILCGWLAYDAFDVIHPFLPAWVTMPVFVAVSAHTGGRLLQVSENAVHDRIRRLSGERKKEEEKEKERR